MPTSNPSRAKIMWWGATLRCARCGSGHIIKRLRLVSDCPRCGLHFEREQGYWTGALAIHFILTGGTVLITLGIIVALTLPHIPAVPAIITLVAVLLVFGLVWYPVSKTLWVAIDRAFMQRLDPGERFDEQTNI